MRLLLAWETSSPTSVLFIFVLVFIYRSSLGYRQGVADTLGHQSAKKEAGGDQAVLHLRGVLLDAEIHQRWGKGFHRQCLLNTAEPSERKKCSTPGKPEKSVRERWQPRCQQG